jgi:hypothetical protein
LDKNDELIKADKGEESPDFELKQTLAIYLLMHCGYHSTKHHKPKQNKTKTCPQSKHYYITRPRRNGSNKAT